MSVSLPGESFLERLPKPKAMASKITLPDSSTSEEPLCVTVRGLFTAFTFNFKCFLSLPTALTLTTSTPLLTKIGLVFPMPKGENFSISLNNSQLILFKFIST